MQAEFFNRLCFIKTELDRLISDVVVYKSTSESCTHPSELRDDCSTMGEIGWRCKRCNYMYMEKRSANGGQ